MIYVEITLAIGWIVAILLCYRMYRKLKRMEGEARIVYKKPGSDTSKELYWDETSEKFGTSEETIEVKNETGAKIRKFEIVKPKKAERKQEYWDKRIKRWTTIKPTKQ